MIKTSRKKGFTFTFWHRIKNHNNMDILTGKPVYKWKWNEFRNARVRISRWMWRERKNTHRFTYKKVLKSKAQSVSSKKTYAAAAATAAVTLPTKFRFFSVLSKEFRVVSVAFYCFFNSKLFFWRFVRSKIVLIEIE